ncbi:MAG: DUF1972 domain-containing protein, partial [Acidobacteriota bacterium]
MKLAIIGTRGVPANYGGFETFAEELGARLADRGHRVTVYGRRGFIDPELGRSLDRETRSDDQHVAQKPPGETMYMPSVVRAVPAQKEA